MNEASGTTPAPSEATPKPKKSAPKKKSVAKKSAPAKKTSNGHANGDAGITLASICKELKLKPRRARRILRGSDGVPEVGARWTWSKAADAAKVKKILTEATSAE